MESLLVDVRRALRRLWRAPGLSFAVIAILALTIAANTTVFSLVNAAYLRRVAADAPDRLVVIATTDTRTGQNGYIYREGLDALRAQRQLFDSVTMYSSFVPRIEARNFMGEASIEAVLPAYFDVVGVRMLMGRSLSESDTVSPNGASPAVISESFWRRRFGGDAGVIGDTMKVDGKAITIVGVTAPGFYGLQIDNGMDVLLPFAFVQLIGSAPAATLRAPYLVARLAPGVTLAQARAEVVGRWPAIQQATAAVVPANLRLAVESQRVTVEPLANGFSGLRSQYGFSLLVLIGLTTVLLAIGCVNVTGLMSARALARRKELAVCRALGAGRSRLLQQMTVEGLLLTGCGLIAGLLLACWAGQLITSMLSFARTIELQLELTPDGRVVGAATAVALLMGLAFGVVPAWQMNDPALDDALRNGRGVGPTLGRSGTVLLVAQVALSMVFLVGAALFAGMLSSLRANDTQFRGRDIVWTRLGRTPGDRGPLAAPYFRRLLDELSAIPGVRSAVLSLYFPAGLGSRGAIPTDTYTAVSGAAPPSAAGLTELVSPGFFDMFGIARLRGRDFTVNDHEGAPAVAIVSESFARRLSGDGDALGARIRIASASAASEIEIVGVVADAPIFTIRDPHLAVVYRPIVQELTRGQFPMAHVHVIGSDDDVPRVRDAYTRVVKSLGRHDVVRVFTLEDWVEYALLQERLIRGMSSSGALLAVLLACLGIHGFLAYAVTVRMREIGVRMALGATRQGIVRMIAREGVLVVVVGILIGISCALALATLIRAQLYGVTPTDPWTIVGSAALFTIVALAAAALPAWRASRIDPLDALRHE